MIKYTVTLLATAGMYLGTSVMASAQDMTGWWTTWWANNDSGHGGRESYETASVPEIDASTGLLALAAVMAAVALAWELKRRRAS